MNKALSDSVSDENMLPGSYTDNCSLCPQQGKRVKEPSDFSLIGVLHPIDKDSDLMFLSSIIDPIS